MTNREYFSSPDDQTRAFEIEYALKHHPGPFELGVPLVIEGLPRLKWLKAEVSPLMKEIPFCPVCGKFPKLVRSGNTLMCPDKRCRNGRLTISNAITTWKARCSYGN